MVVRRYHESTGKRCVAHDEFIEHANKFYLQLPLPKFLASFEAQSQNIGASLMCKQFTDLWYSFIWTGDDTPDYKKSVSPMMTPEKQLIYEVFTLLRTTKVITSRSSFWSDFVASIKDKVTVNLCRKVLERSIHDSPSTSCDDILASLDLVYVESINRAGLDPVVETRLNKEDFEEIDIPQADQTTKSSAKTTTNEKVK